MIHLDALLGYFARAGKGILQMRRDRLFGASVWTGGLPDANDAPYAIAADETDGVQASQPDGMGGYTWTAIGAGPQGPQGATGATGDTGPTGPTGPQGAGITAATTTVAAFARLHEATNNGTNYVDVSAPTSVASNRTQTLQDASGTIALTGQEGLVYIAGGSFSATSSTSANSVFTSSYDTYVLVVDASSVTLNGELAFRLRVGGVDASTNYDHGLYYEASNSTRAGVGQAAVAQWLLTRAVGVVAEQHCVATLWYPNKADQTSFSSQGSGWRTDNIALATWHGGVHRAATAYDGFTIFPTAGVMTGTWRLYGYRSS